MKNFNNRGIAPIVILLVVAGILVAAGGVWYWQSQKIKPVACPQDAKICSNGTTVGRTGPNCEFTPCPTGSEKIEIKVISPNGGEKLKTGTFYKINWQYNPSISPKFNSVFISLIGQYSGYNSWSIGVNKIIYLKDTSYEWKVGEIPVLPGGFQQAPDYREPLMNEQYKIKVCLGKDNIFTPTDTICDESDGSFIITNNEKILPTWENLIPNIRTIIGPTFLGVRVEESRPMSIYKEADITGDGVSEALVNLGTGGAYTTSLTLMMIENNKPVIAQFKQKNGKVSPLMFLDGASVMNGGTVGMLSNRNTIYTGHWSRAVSGTPFGSLTNCSVEAYQWNAQAKTFDFNTSLSNEIRPDFCRKAEQ